MHCPSLETVDPMVGKSTFAVLDTWSGILDPRVKMRSYQQLVRRLQLQLKHSLQNQMTFPIVYKAIATHFDDTNDAKLNNKHNVQLIRKEFHRFRIIWIDTLRWIIGCHSSGSILALICIRRRTMSHKYTLSPGVQMDGLSHRWWSELDPVSRNVRMPLPIQHITNITVGIQFTDVRARFHLR
jgi:hypothetical protein